VQNLRVIKEVVERPHQEYMEGGRKGKEDETDHQRGHQAEGKAPEGDSTVQEENVE
jgi:hypothetical protein